ncbi:cyclic nucleotide-binding/CBS domain-containing protein [Shimia aestuarii]|uniref:CBS domain-containing protein n=1 Tax=Shimia aestuarii TaxID=254406 RepID=A0A1I4JWY7_9RHOB|nr:CBS domain-containing protein [Shimia aestuarii]SFL70737.1 CBS domain-containing protein [Shimia aestuarii]
MSTTTLRALLANRPIHTVSPDTPLREVALKMAQQRVGAVAVTAGGTLRGILTERDIVFRGVAQGLASDTATADQVMTPDPVTVDIDDAISDALAAKLGDAFRHLPVMENGTLVGILSFRDIPAEYVMMFERFREMSSAHADDGA